MRKDADAQRIYDELKRRGELNRDPEVRRVFTELIKRGAISDVAPVVMKPPVRTTTDLQDIGSPGMVDVASPTVGGFLNNPRSGTGTSSMTPALEQASPRARVVPNVTPTGAMKGTSLPAVPAKPKTSAEFRNEDAIERGRQGARRKQEEGRQRRAAQGMPKGAERQRAMAEREHIASRLSQIYGKEFVPKPGDTEAYKRLRTEIEQSASSPDFNTRRFNGKTFEKRERRSNVVGDREDFRRLVELDDELKGDYKALNVFEEQMENNALASITANAVGNIVSAALPTPASKLEVLRNFIVPIATAMGTASATGTAKEAVAPMSPEGQERVAKAREDFAPLFPGSEGAWWEIPGFGSVMNMVAQNPGAPLGGKLSLVPSLSMARNAGIGGGLSIGTQLAQTGEIDPVTTGGDIISGSLFNNPYYTRPTPRVRAGTKPKKGTLGIPEAQLGQRYRQRTILSEPLGPPAPPEQYGPPLPPASPAQTVQTKTGKSTRTRVNKPSGTPPVQEEIGPDTDRRIVRQRDADKAYSESGIPQPTLFRPSADDARGKSYLREKSLSLPEVQGGEIEVANVIVDDDGNTSALLRIWDDEGPSTGQFPINTQGELNAALTKLSKNSNATITFAEASPFTPAPTRGKAKFTPVPEKPPEKGIVAPAERPVQGPPVENAQVRSVRGGAGRKRTPKALTPEQQESLGKIVASEEKTAMESAVTTVHSGKPYTLSTEHLSKEDVAFLDTAAKSNMVTVESDGKRLTVTPSRNSHAFLNEYIASTYPEAPRPKGRPSSKPKESPFAMEKEEPAPVKPDVTKAEANLRARLEKEGVIRFPSEPKENAPVRPFLDAEVAAGRLVKEKGENGSVLYRKKKVEAEPAVPTNRPLKPREVAITLEGDHPRLSSIRKGLEKRLLDKANPDQQGEAAVTLRTFGTIKRKGWDVRANKDGFTLYDPKGKQVGQPVKNPTDAAIAFGEAVGLTESDYTGRQNMRLPNKDGWSTDPDPYDRNPNTLRDGDFVLVKTARGVRLDKIINLIPGSGSVRLRHNINTSYVESRLKTKGQIKVGVGNYGPFSIKERRPLSDIVAVLNRDEIDDVDFLESVATDTSPMATPRIRGQKELMEGGQPLARAESELPREPHAYLDALEKSKSNAQKKIDELKKLISVFQRKADREKGPAKSLHLQDVRNLEENLQEVIDDYNRIAESEKFFAETYPERGDILKERRIGYRGDVSIAYDPDITSGKANVKTGGITLRVEGDISNPALKRFIEGKPFTSQVRYQTARSNRPRVIKVRGSAEDLRAEWDRIHDFFELPRRPYPRQIAAQEMKFPDSVPGERGNRRVMGSTKTREGLVSIINFLRDSNAISKEDAAIATDFITELPPEYFDGLTTIAMEKNKGQRGVAGYYENSTRIAAFMADTLAAVKDSGRVVPLHEISHSLERFIFREDAQALYKQYRRERRLWELAGSPDRFKNQFEDFSEWFAESIRTNWLRQRGIPDPMDLYFLDRSVEKSRFSPKIAKILHQSHILAYTLAKRLFSLGHKDTAKMVWDRFVGGVYRPDVDYHTLQWRESGIHEGILPMVLPKDPAKPGVTFGGEESIDHPTYNATHYWLRSPLSIYAPNHDSSATGAGRFGDPITMGSWETLSPERGGKASREARNAQLELGAKIANWNQRIDSIGELLRVARGESRILGAIERKSQDINKRAGLIAETKQEKQFREFVDLIEMEFSNPARKSADPNIQKALDLHDELTKDWLQYLRDSQEELGATHIDPATGKEVPGLPPDWGVTDRGYFRHMFLGNLKMRVYDPIEKKWKFHKDFRTYNDALMEARALLKADPSLNIDIGGSVNATEGISRVSTKRFHQTVNEMVKSASSAASTAAGTKVTLTKKDMLDDLNGLAMSSTKRKPLTLLLKRTGVDGYSKAYEEVMKATAYQTARAQELSKLNRKIVPLIEAEGTQGDKRLADEMQEYVNNLWGMPANWETDFGRVIGYVARRGAKLADAENPLLRAYGKLFEGMDGAEPVATMRNVARHLTNFQSFLKLSYNLKSAAVNLYQPMTTLWPYAKSKDLLSAYKLAFNSDFRKQMVERGVLSSSSKMESGDIVITADANNPFMLASQTNRAVGYAYGWEQAKAGKLSDEQAHIMGLAWAELVEFDNSAWNTPAGLRSPITRVLGQFKGFEIKNAERLFKAGGALNLTDKRTPKQKLAAWAKYTSALTFGAGLNSLGPLSLVVGTLVYGAAYRVAEESGMEPEDADRFASLWQSGVPSAFKYGVDVSSSLQILQEPYGNDTAEKMLNYFGGPTITSGVRAFDTVSSFLRTEKMPTVATLGGITPYARQVDSLLQFVFTEDEAKEPGMLNDKPGGFWDDAREVARVRIGNENEITLNAVETLQRAAGFTPTKISAAYAHRDMKAEENLNAKREENRQANQLKMERIGEILEKK